MKSTSQTSVAQSNTPRLSASPETVTASLRPPTKPYHHSNMPTLAIKSAALANNQLLPKQSTVQSNSQNVLIQSTAHMTSLVLSTTGSAGANSSSEEVLLSQSTNQLQESGHMDSHVEESDNPMKDA